MFTGLIEGLGRVLATAAEAAGLRVGAMDAIALSNRPQEAAERVAAGKIDAWAIGTGVTATSDDAQAMCASVRDQVSKSFGEAAGLRVRVQYGGSAKPANAAELVRQPDIDGLLVGGASLDPDEFARIVQAAGSAS